MSDCDSLQNKLRMCPCNKENDIPQSGQYAGMEGNDQDEAVENGVDVILPSDSGSDEETDTLEAQGYISLAQSEDDVSTLCEIEQAEQESPAANNDEKPTVKPHESEENKTVLEASTSSSFSSTQNSQMDEDEINLIKSVMKNIQLPSSAIPEWAKKIPEEKWKAPLVSALQQRTDRNKESTEKSDIQSLSKTV